MGFVTCIVPPQALGEPKLKLAGQSFHHLFRVRRLSQGVELRLVDGLGTARWGRVEEVGAVEATVWIGEPAPTHEAELQVELWVAPTRPQRATWLVEKATEVGATAVRWLESARAGRQVTPPRLDRLRRVAESAVEQCHRSLVPELSLHTWSEALEGLRRASRAWYLDPGAREGSLQPDPSGLVGLLVGPEGGWNDDERTELANVGVAAVGLGARVLRTETAAVVGAALLLCRGTGAESRLGV